MSAQESLISFIEDLKLDDAKFSEFQKMIEKKLAPKNKKSNVDEIREDVFPKDTKKTTKKESGTTIRHKGPIRINPNNPKKVNCKSWIAYEAYKNAKSYEEFKELGGESKHYKYDLDKGLIIELTDEQLKLLAEDPNYNFFKEGESTDKKLKSSKGKISKKEKATKPESTNDDNKEENTLNDKSSEEEKKSSNEQSILGEDLSDDKISKLTLSGSEENNKTKNSSKTDKEEIPKPNKSPEDLKLLLETLLNDIIEELVTQENYQNNKRANITQIKKRLFENSEIKKGFKSKNDNTLVSEINLRYNEKSSFYEKKCQQEFEESIKEEDEPNSDNDEETEEIEVVEYEYDGTTYNLDPKTNYVYDIETNEQIGKCREGIIIFD